MLTDNFITLAIDTSCDETSVAVVRGLTVLSNVLPSQMKYHKKYGGVVPSLAKFAHESRIENVVIESMKRAQVDFKDIDAIAVTIGPGLAIALEVGIKKAIELAKKYKKPLLTINHMEGHLYSSLAQRVKTDPKEDDDSISALSKINFPVLGFLVSGGHTELILVKDFLEYERVGETLDDSCGEAFDKCGRMLGLGYPAGAIITQFAKLNRANVDITFHKKSAGSIVRLLNRISGNTLELTVPMTHSNDLRFSYSGLKTAFRYLIQSISGEKITISDELDGKTSLTKEMVYDLCSVFEASALKQLSFKLEKAIQMYYPKEIWLGGGVVASQRLRSEMRSVAKKYGIKINYPYSKKLTTDNAAMIGVAANIRLSKVGFSTLKKSKKHQDLGLYFDNFKTIDRKPNLDL